MERISAVQQIKVSSVQFSSIFFVGDNVVIRARTKALAVQREIPVFQKDEYDFADFPIFSVPLPKPVVDENISMNIVNESPWIKVGSVRILSVTVSSVFQVGSNCVIDTETRLKHFRQFTSRETYEAALAAQKKSASEGKNA